LPAATMYREREASRGALAQRILRWRHATAEHWSKLRFGQVNCETVGDLHNFRVQVYLGELESDAAIVELYAQARNGELPMRQPMARGEALPGSVSGFIYTAQVPSNRPADDYTPRILPAFPAVHVPLEMRQILWQR